MIRLLYVITSTTIGGAEKTLARIATRVDRRGFEVAGVVSLKPPGFYADKLAEAGIPVETLEMPQIPRPSDLGRLRAAIRRFSPDIVHAFLYRAIQFCRLAKLAGEPMTLISSPRVVYRTRPAPLLWLDRQLMEADDLLIAESVATQRFFVRHQGYEPSRISIIHNGIEPSELVAPPEAREARRLELGVRPGELLVGTVGRLDPQKGQDVLLKALAMLPERFKGLVIGDGPDRERLEERRRTLGLSRRCLLLGESRDVAGWLAALDVFVLPSYWEGIPNAALEALASGLPVAASAVDGVLEVVEDGRTGLLFPPGDPQALAAALTRLAGDPALRARLAEDGRRHVLERFTLDRMIRSYEDAYRRLAPRA